MNMCLSTNIKKTNPDLMSMPSLPVTKAAVSLVTSNVSFRTNMMLFVVILRNSTRSIPG